LEHSDKSNRPVLDFLECAPDSDVPDLVDKLVSWGKWEEVCELLDRPAIARELRDHVLELFFETVLKHCTISEKNWYAWKNTSYMLPLIQEPDLQQWMRRFVELGWWYYVGDNLKKGVSKELKEWAVEEARKRFAVDNDHDAFKLIINSHPEKFSEEMKMEQYIRKYKWDDVEKMLKDGLPQALHEETVKRVIQQADDETVRSVLRTFKKSQYESELVKDLLKAAERGLSETVKDLREKLQWDRELCRLLRLSLEKLSGSKKQPRGFLAASLSDQNRQDDCQTNEAETRNLPADFQLVVEDVLSLLKSAPLKTSSNPRQSSKSETFYNKISEWCEKLETVDVYQVNIREALKELIMAYQAIRKYQSDDDDDKEKGTGRRSIEGSRERSLRDSQRLTRKTAVGQRVVQTAAPFAGETVGV
jgi:hypothetical protein